MTPPVPTTSRRGALKLLAGVPMLPLGGLASCSLLPACGGGSTAAYVSTTFTGMAAPTLANPAAMATTTVGSSMKVAFADGSSQTYALAYQPFFLTGDRVSDGKGGRTHLVSPLVAAATAVLGRLASPSDLPAREKVEA